MANRTIVTERSRVVRKLPRSWKEEYPTSAAEYTEQIRQKADTFTCSCWHGFPTKYETHRFKKEEQAKKFAEDNPRKRPWAIYAVAGGRDVHLYNVPPTVLVKK